MFVHQVPQNRFSKNKDLLFDIDLKEDEQQVVDTIRNTDNTLIDYLISARGVELSKYGKVCICNACRMWLPYPNKDNPKCPHCGTFIENANSVSIVSRLPVDGYEPILVGENIKRYIVDSNYWIAVDKKGINYKSQALYSGPKIVVRKTGVGLSAAIDYKNLLTNQVVYMFKLRAQENNVIPIEFFLALMNSRAIYYYLVKSHGETEWRSHPYLTQKQILDLPLPKGNVTTGQRLSAILNIRDSVKPYLRRGMELPQKIDALVERRLAYLYGLRRKHYEIIYSTINEVEELLPIKALKKIKISDIFDKDIK